ncbi:MAG TPA: anaerobic ribonucleoside triphosphate reductase [Firmicutes bacterium]|nr:anaerobic ribonucleoside triphosphate reductase [Bacillota bacterium]
MNKIIKRDGRIVKFDRNKIFSAIFKAFASLDIDNEDLINNIVDEVIDRINNKYNDKLPRVEDVQDEIEKVLIEHNEAEVAKAYILYRANRTRIRESKTHLMETLKDITFKDAKDNNTKRENANIDGDTAMGCMLRYGSESAKEFYLSNVIDPRFAKAHREGDIHIHDMDFYTLTMTCCQIDILELFKNGFSTGHGFLREPQSIRSYSSLACIAIQANQNDMHGGQSIPNFDYGMAPGVIKTYRKSIVRNICIVLGTYVDHICKDEAKEIVKEAEELSHDECRIGHKDFENSLYNVIATRFEDLDDPLKLTNFILKTSYNETREETYQAMEALIHNLNTMHSRAGAQVPFSSLNYGTDTSIEGRMVIDCLLDATLAGLGDGETPIFPIQIFKLKEGVSYNKEDPNYDLFRKAIRVSGARLFPNFSFLDAPFNLKYYKKGDYKTEISYMGCRTRVMGNVDKTKEITTGRGNLSFTSINLPRLGIKHKNDIDGFFNELDEKMDLVKDQLLERFKIQCSKKVYNFPFLMGQHIWLDSDKLKWNDTIESVIRHGTLTVGFIGLAECLKALIGKHHGESDEAQELGVKIIGHMRDKTDEYTKKYNLNFSLIATPAEGLSGRFVKIDKEKYGIIPGVTDRDYYTNSFHIPVYYKISIFDKIKKEGPYNALTNGGHITYVEVDGDVAKNEKAFESIIRCMHDNGIGYGSVNHPIDRDPVCGYNGIIDECCPKCGRHEDDTKFERIRRITGYLVGTTERFNDAKKVELSQRVKHLTKDNL